MSIRWRYLSDSRRVKISTLIFQQHAIKFDKPKHKFLSTHILNHKKKIISRREIKY